MSNHSPKLDTLIADVCRDKNDLLARKNINDEFRKILTVYHRSKDIRPLNRFVSRIPDRKLLENITKHICERLPFIVIEKGLAADKSRMTYLSPQLINRFNLMDGVLLKNTAKGIISVDCDQNLGIDEFVSWLADTLTLRRKEFTSDHLEHLTEILSMIKDRTKAARQGSK